MPATGFTLLIPTYNRAAEFARLLSSLTAQKAAFPIVVLDSSDSAHRARNAGAASASGLDIVISVLDPATPPFDKFAQGAARVTTPYCSMCADDDILIAASIAPILAFLEENPSYAAAHGWYFSFVPGDDIDIPEMAYHGASITAEKPLYRMNELLSRYEAVTYAVTKTHVMREALEKARDASTVMAQELMAGSITALAGEIARLPLLYYGRSLAQSQAYHHWHPATFLAASPRELFVAYSGYRETLLAHLRAQGLGIEAGTGDLIDLIHLRYIAHFLTPEALDYVIERKLVGAPYEDILCGVLPLTENAGRKNPWLRAPALLRNLKRLLTPGLRPYHVRRMLRPGGHRTLHGTTSSGRSRKYELFAEFNVAMAAAPSLEVGLDDLVRALNGYE